MRFAMRSSSHRESRLGFAAGLQALSRASAPDLRSRIPDASLYALADGAELTLPAKNVSLAEWFNPSKENGNGEYSFSSTEPAYPSWLQMINRPGA